MNSNIMFEATQINGMTLAATGWNVAKAARRLGIGRRTIYRRIKKYSLQRPDG